MHSRHFPPGPSEVKSGLSCAVERACEQHVFTQSNEKAGIFFFLSSRSLPLLMCPFQISSCPFFSASTGVHFRGLGCRLPRRPDQIREDQQPGRGCRSTHSSSDAFKHSGWSTLPGTLSRRADCARSVSRCREMSSRTTNERPTHRVPLSRSLRLRTPGSSAVKGAGALH